MKMAKTMALFVLIAVDVASAAPAWTPPELPSPRDVTMGGAPGDDLRRGLDRLALPPYEVPWLLADVSFGVKRIFTNYSGDVSGRFLELAALTSPRDRFAPPSLEAVLGQVLPYQRPDGHFGADFDLAKPFERNTTQKTAPLPMFWGNGRILVGLVAVAQERGRPDFLEAAKRLGDYYVAGADQMLAPAREAEYKSTGTYGDSYVCDYFPAIEGLALLYRATKDGRYLGHALRMAEAFRRFDALPIDHSHGNLCAWRGILMLHDITKDRALLDAARAKWDAAVTGGFIWPIGGLGEHWHVKYHVTEACSESDWLRFNLELWRFTGETRYLDRAERVLLNQYRINQGPNGGFGSRQLDVDAAGPWAVKPKLEEWNFCCSFHGPLGLHYLKSYLAASSERGIYINFPVDFAATVRWGGEAWSLKVERKPRSGPVEDWSVALAPADGGSPARAPLWMRVPGQADYHRVPEDGVVSFTPGLALEARRFQRVPAEIGRYRDVAVLLGSRLLFAPAATGDGRPTILVPIGESGRLRMPAAGEGFATVMLPFPEADAAAVASAMASGPAVLLRPWGAFPAKQRASFMFDVVVAPWMSLGEERLQGIADRAAEAGGGADAPVFGEDLEKRRELWPEIAGWTFRPDGLFVAGGDVGLLNAEGYRDYRFEFDLTLPVAGQGLAGWVVRAQGADDCVMYQIQSDDSPYSAPEYKTKPNALRPHLRRGGAWAILDPVPLPKQVRRGETHRVATVCHGDAMEVFLDGEKVHAMRVPDHRAGGVGFRAGSPAEQGLFRRVALTKSD